ncbi:MAG TPA: ATPase, T2SS/T4P/T4SS family, partial [Pirellulales bacterium]|nr:ATPase, T2SS/T4P/T4SS family [Pirellulales bacterium]
PNRQGGLREEWRFLPKVSGEGERMSRETIYEASVDYFLTPIGALLEDESVTEIMVNGFDQIYVERRGKIETTNARFDSADALISAIHNIAQWVGREIDPERPILDARLPNGSRVNAIIPPSARTGTYLTIRKFSKKAYTMADLVDFDSISPQVCELLDICVRLKKNILISGGTGTGKTTFLGAVSESIPDDERIVVIEDTSELRLPQEHCLFLEAQQGDRQGRGRLTVRQLFINSLRMRPDRIIVGEVRSGEALDLVQSMISGHSGSLSTVHANTARDALIRMETLSLMSDIEIPVYVARAQVASAIDLVVQITRFAEDGSRKITRVTEAFGLDEQNRYQFQDLFVSRLKGKHPDGSLDARLEWTETQPTFASEPLEQGMDARIKLTEKLWTP